MDALHALQGPAYWALMVHAASGGVALAAGAVALGLRKGATLHRRVGMIFVVAMLASLAFGIPVAVVRHNVFLGLLTPFVAYMVLRGLLAAYRAGLRAQRILAGAAFATSAGLVLFAGSRLLAGHSALGFTGAMFVLGAVGMWRTLGDYRLPPPIRPPASVLAHATSMVGGYTAAFTAFVAVNVRGDIPAVLVFSLPVAAGTALAFWWAARINGGRAALELPEDERPPVAE